MSAGFTSGTTRGVSWSILNALLLSITSVPAAAATGAKRLLTLAPAQKRGTGAPERREHVVRQLGDVDGCASERDLRPGGTGRCERDQPPHRKSALFEDLYHLSPHHAGRSGDNHINILCHPSHLALPASACIPLHVTGRGPEEIPLHAPQPDRTRSGMRHAREGMKSPRMSIAESSPQSFSARAQGIARRR